MSKIIGKDLKAIVSVESVDAIQRMACAINNLLLPEIDSRLLKALSNGLILD